jgi:protein TonB
MSKVSVFDREWIDLVFEGRNQQYGAYQLRKESSKTTILALFSALALVGILVAIPVAINYFKADTPVVPSGTIIDEVVIADLHPTELPKKDPVVEPPKTAEATPPAAAPKSNTATVAFKPLETTAGPVDEVPKTDDFKDANPGNTTSPGNSDGTVVIGSNGGDGTKDSKGTAATGPDESDKVISSFEADVAPMFPGGLPNFGKKVIDNFNPLETNSEMTLKVLVSFIVEKDGTMTDIRIVRDPGYGMGKEAIKALKAIKTKWTPGKKGGKPVRTAYTLPIVLNVK